MLSHAFVILTFCVEMPAELYDQNTAQFLGFAHKIIHCFYYKCSQNETCFCMCIYSAEPILRS